MKLIKKYIAVLMVIILSLTLISCEKRFWDYDCIWFSENPYIYIDRRNLQANIEIDGEIITTHLSIENDGTNMEFYKNTGTQTSPVRNTLFTGTVKIKSGVMYLTIEKDGENNTYTLKQQSY